MILKSKQNNQFDKLFKTTTWQKIPGDIKKQHFLVKFYCLTAKYKLKYSRLPLKYANWTRPKSAYLARVVRTFWRHRNLVVCFLSYN